MLSLNFVSFPFLGQGLSTTEVIGVISQKDSFLCPKCRCKLTQGLVLKNPN